MNKILYLYTVFLRTPNVNPEQQNPIPGAKKSAERCPNDCQGRNGFLSVSGKVEPHLQNVARSIALPWVSFT